MSGRDDIPGKLALARERLARGDSDGVRQVCLELCPLASNDPELLLLLSELYSALGAWDQALPLLMQYIDHKPSDNVGFFRLGNVFYGMGQWEGAALAFENALLLKPGHAAAWNNLALALKEAGQFDRALNALQKALSIDPQFTDAQLNHANLLLRLGEPALARGILEPLSRRIPEHPPVWSNLGNCYQAQRRLQEAVAAHRRAIALYPDDALLRWNLAIALLSVGEWAEGWTAYEAGIAAGMRPKLAGPEPIWDGSPLDGQWIRIYAEQGCGDAIQFVRYVDCVAQRGGKILLQCPPVLRSLFSRMDAVEAVVTEPEGRCQAQISLLSLPRVFQTTVATIPHSGGYLRAPEALAERWSQRLPQGRPRVGIVWAGNPAHQADALRSCPFPYFASLLEKTEYQFVSLQIARERAREPMPPQLFDPTAELSNFDDTAALIANLDLVVTVDTAVAHLAGALGRPVWVLLAYDSDWRWLRHGRSSPWYASMRLFRQRAPGDWPGVLAEVRAALGREKAFANPIFMPD